MRNVRIAAVLAVILALSGAPSDVRAQATIAFVQGNYAVPQSPQTVVPVAFTAAQTAGNLNVVIVGWNDSAATVTSVTDTRGHAYAVAVGPTVRNGSASQTIYYARNITGGAGNTVTVRFSAAAVYPDIRILEYRGLDPTAPLHTAVAGSGSSATSSSGSLTTSVANVLLVAGNVVATSTSGAGANFTNRMITSPDGDIAEDRIVSAAGTYSASAALSRSGYWVMQLVAFKAATGTPPPDTTTPTVSITAPTAAPTLATNASPLALGGSATDNVGVTQVSWTNDRGGSGPATGTGAWSATGIGLQPGVNVLTVTARDAAGNAGATTLTVTYDITAPTASIATPTAGPTFTTNASPLALSGSASDDVVVTQVSWSNSRGGSGTAVGTTAWSATGIALQSGANVLTVTARDAAGNAGVVTLTVNYDPVAPTVSITAPTAGPTLAANASPLALGGTAADNVGVTQVSWTNDRGGSGVAAGTGAWSAPGIALQPGANVLTVTARDAAGNAATTTLTVTFDITAPALTITAPTAGPTFVTRTSPITLGGSAGDNLGVTQVSWTNDRGGSGTATGTATWSATGIAVQPGDNVLTATARDAAGNTGTGTLTVTYDPIAPTVSITTPTAGATYTTSDSPLDLGGSAADNLAVTQVSWANNRGGSGTATGTGAWSVTGIALQPGANVLTATARDAAGNVGTATLTVTYTAPDTAAPTVSITSPTAAATLSTNTSPLALGGTANDNVGVTQVTWSNDRGGAGSASGTTSWSVTGIALQPGANVLTVTASDAAGNAGTATLTVAHDPTPPTVAITTPTAAATFSATATPLALGGTANDDVGVTQVAWSNNRGGSGTAVGTTSWSVTAIALQSGDNVVTATSRDAAGNTATATLTVTYTPPDAASPTVTITTPTAAATYTTNASPLALGGTASDNVGVTQVAWSNDRGGSGTATGTGSWTAAGIALQPGANALTVTASDAAGNVGTATVTAMYDPTSPTVAITAPTPAATYSTSTSSLALGGTAADNVGVTQVTWSNDRGGGGTATGTATWSTPGITLLPGTNVLTVTARDAAANLATAVLTVTYTQPLGLVGAYAFNEVSGTTTADASGSGNTGTLLNGATFAAGKNGNALSVDGVNDYANLGNPTSLQITGSLTISAWINSSAFPADDAAVVSKKGNSVAGYQLDTTIDRGPRTIGFKLTSSSGANMARYGSTALQLNTWYHVAGVYDAAARTLNVYLNGQLNNGTLVGTVTATQQQSSTLSAAIGRKSGNTGFEFTGRIDDVRIYSRALSLAEIQADMNAPVGGAPPPDTTPPTVAITGPTSAASLTTNASPLTLSGTAADNVGVTQVSWANDRGGAGTATGTGSWSAPGIVLQPGGNVLTATARDAAGNTGTGTLTVSYDPTAPTVSITAPTAATTYTTDTSPLALGGTAADNAGVTQVTWSNDRGGSGPAAGTTTWSVAGVVLQPGANVVTVTARDAAGNLAAATLAVTYTAPDTTAPVVSITAPTTAATFSTNSTPVTLGGTGTDNVGVTQVTWSNDRGGSGTASGAGIWTASGIVLQLGANVLTVTARDAAGNLGTASVTATYDPTPPTMAITTPTAGPTYTTPTSPLTLGGTAADDIGVTQVTWSSDRGGSGTATGTTTWSVSGISLLPGTNVLTVTARDAANNVSTAGLTVTYTAPTGLVGAYGFNETSGATALDSSGAGNHGTLLNGAIFAPGKNGNAVTLDGVNDYVNLGNPVSLQITGSLTISGWVNASAFPADDAAILSKRGNTVAGYQLDTTIDRGPRTIGFKLTASTGGDMARYGSTGLGLSQWYHVAGVYNAAAQTLNVYLNGQLDNGVLVGVITGSQQNSALSVAIGRKPGNTGFEFAGKIDDVRIYGRALTQAEIQADMSTPVGGTPAPDTTPPTVTITAPVAGSTVVNVVTVSANASDDIGVVGVQFFADGVPLGPEVQSAPYAVPWDTTTVAPGPHVLTASARDASGKATISAGVTVTVAVGTQADAGQWAGPFTWPLVAIHASLLTTGNILLWDIETSGQGVQVWNPTTNTFTAVPFNNENLFCSGLASLPNGKILVTGGHRANFVGLTDATLFDPVTQSWASTGRMAFPRWYPTTTALPDGRMLVMSGSIDCETCTADTPEVYDPATGTWTRLDNATLTLSLYPHVFVLPDGRVLVTGSSESYEEPVVAHVLQLATQTWTVVDPVPVNGGSAAMYLPGKIVTSGLGTAGGADVTGTPSTATTYVLDMTQPLPAWRQTPPMQHPRDFHTMTILPDGDVLVTGGGETTGATDAATAVFAAELWSPATETWTTMASMSVPRLYHSTALLLPDGRVLVAGGGRNAGVGAPTTFRDRLSAEIYSPPYLFRGPRPTISSAPATMSYGANVFVATPDGAGIAAVSLIRTASVTHAFNQDQRFVPLTFQPTSGGLTVQAPANANLAPPGHYLLFILDANGLPSIAKIVKVQ